MATTGSTISLRRARTSAVGALAAIAASLLVVVAPPAQAAVGQVRVVTPDYPLGPTANEAPARGKSGPGLAVNPTNPAHVVETHQDLATQECEYNVSTDGGTTWTGGELQAPAGFPSDLPGPCSVVPHGGVNIGQQSVAFGSGSTVYVTWVSSPNPSDTTIGYSVLLSTSTDGGSTFAPAVEVLMGGSAPRPNYAAPELVVDRRSVATTDDRIYIAARDARTSQAVVVRSDNSGVTFEAPVQASDTGAPAPAWNAGNSAVTTPGNAFTRAIELTQPVLGPVPSGGGERPLYVGWVGIKDSGACPPSCETAGETAADGYLVVAESTDLGQTWSRRRAVNVRGPVLPTGSVSPGTNFPRLAAGGGGDLYMVFNQGPGLSGSNNCGPGPFPGPQGGATHTCPSYGSFSAADYSPNWGSDVYFIRSINGGTTWGDLKRINDPRKPGLAAPEVLQTRHPQVYVAADGRIDLVWHDRRHWFLGTSDRKGGGVHSVETNPANWGCLHSEANCPEARLGDTYYARSRNRGVSFTANRRVNDRSHNLDVGWDYRLGTYRDYGPAIAHLGTEELLVADMDSRRGNESNDSQDIFLRRLDLNAGGGPIPVEDAGTGDAPAFSVALSQRTYPGGSEAVPGSGNFTCEDAAPSCSRPWTRPVIVNEADMPAALAGGVLARANVAPVLASPVAGLPAAVKAEVDRLDPTGAYVIGDATKLSPQVEADLAAAGVPLGQIVRISAATPADLAASIARDHLDRRRAPHKSTSPPLPAFDAVVIANPNSASAASASALAANRRLPILFVDQNSVPAATSAAISQLGVTKTLIVGSTSVISPAVAAALPNPTRLGTGDQFNASDAVVNESVARGLPKNIVYVADGNRPMHAALMGAAVGRTGGLLTLAPGGTATAAESTVNAVGLCPVVDRLVVSTLTSTAVVADDPGDGSSGAGAGPCPAPPAEPAPETVPPFARPLATLSGQASRNVTGGTISDTVTVTGLAGIPSPTGAVTFSIYGPNDATCTGPVVGSSTHPLSGGTATSDPFPFGRPGTYRFVASYSGDANYAPSTTPCNAPTQSVVGGTTVADFDGNGTTELSMFRPSTGAWLLRDQIPDVVAYGTAGDIAVPADYDGDGRAEIAVFRPSQGIWFIRGGPTVAWGTSEDIPVPADYDGDGTAEIAVFRPSQGVWFIRGGPTVAWGTSEDIPVPGDYNGDHVTELAVFRPSSGVWFVQGGPTTAWGISGDIPVPGDYDGNGTTDVAVFRPSSGVWFVQGGPTVAWGTSGDIPVPGDYDASGTTDFAVFRPSTWVWYVQGGPTEVFGSAGDDPLPLPAAIRQFPV